MTYNDWSSEEEEENKVAFYNKVNEEARTTIWIIGQLHALQEDNMNPQEIKDK